MIWNSIDYDLKCFSFSSFKSSLKEHLANKSFADDFKQIPVFLMQLQLYKL